jgi:HK97 family phage major capsid protein
MYKVLKALEGHKPGDVIELDPANFATKHFLAQGTIEEALGAEDALMVNAIETVAATLAKSIETATAKSLEVIGKAASRGPKIAAGDSEHDRKKSLGHQLCLIADAMCTSTPVVQAEKAVTVLKELYGASFSNWQFNQPGSWGQKAALAEGAGVQGGYGVFPEYSGELLRIAIEDTVLASRARQIPMAAQEIHIPALDQTTAPGSAGQTAYTGGMVAYWTAEAAARQETEPKFKQVTLRANELSGYTLASRTLLADNGIALEALLGDLIRETVAWYLDYACFQGSGANQPLGVLNAGALVTVSSRANTGKFGLPDAASMLGSLLPRSRRNAIWAMGPDTVQQLLQLSDTSGRVVFLPNFVPIGPANYGGSQGSAQVMPDNNMILFGLPVYVTEKLPALGTAGDVLLIDPSYYLVGKRMDIEVAASEHYRFTNNQITWRFVARLDGQPWLDKAFTLQDTSRTLSAFVALHA